MKLILTTAAAQRLRAHLESTGGAHLLPPQLRRVHKRLARGISKEDRDTGKRARDHYTYEAVTDRDEGCTASPIAFGACSGALQIDHQWGRGKAPTMVENCRRLCTRHHQMKTDSQPSRARWLMDFMFHARKYGYSAEAQKARAALALEEGQHPHRTPTEAA